MAPPADSCGPRPVRPSHRAAPELEVFIVWSGRADHRWLRLLRPGFRHCFAALRDASGWSVADPLTNRLVLARLDIPPGHDLPRFYRRAGMTVLGPFAPAPPGGGGRLLLSPFSCVSVCRALLGPRAPFAWTPHGLYRALRNLTESRKENLTAPSPGVNHSLVNGRIASAGDPLLPPNSTSTPGPPLRGPGVLVSFGSGGDRTRDEGDARAMGGLFRTPKPVVVEAPAPAPAAAALPPAPAPAEVAEQARTEARARARGGIAGTVATAPTGVLAPIAVSRRSLLGE